MMKSDRSNLGKRLAERCLAATAEIRTKGGMELASPPEKWTAEAFRTKVLPRLKELERERLESLALCRIPHSLRKPTGNED